MYWHSLQGKQQAGSQRRGCMVKESNSLYNDWMGVICLIFSRGPLVWGSYLSRESWDLLFCWKVNFTWIVFLGSDHLCKMPCVFRSLILDVSIRHCEWPVSKSVQICCYVVPFDFMIVMMLEVFWKASRQFLTSNLATNQEVKMKNVTSNRTIMRKINVIFEIHWTENQLVMKVLGPEAHHMSSWYEKELPICDYLSFTVRW